MSQSHGPTLENLLSEQWNDTAARSEDVAEPHNDERLSVGGLSENESFGNSLGCPVRADRLHHLVGADHDEPFHLGLTTRRNQVVGSEYVVLNRLNRVGLHHWNVLVSGGVEDNVRPQSPDEEVHVVPVLQLTDDRNNRCSFPDAFFLENPEFPVHVVDAVLTVPEQIEALGAAREKLAGKLAADAASGAGDEHTLAAEIGEARFEIHANRVACEKIFRVNVPRLDQVGLTVNDLSDGRDNSDLHESGPNEQEIDLLQAIPGDAGHRNERLVGRSKLEKLNHVVYWAEDRRTVDPRSDLFRIVIKKGHHLAQDTFPTDLHGDRGSGESCADDVDAVCTVFHEFALAAFCSRASDANSSNPKSTRKLSL